MPANTTNMTTFAAADGLKLAYYIDDFCDPWRTPDTLLLLHAAMGSSLRWFNWVPRLARHFRVVRLDLRGHGNSGVPRAEQPFSLGDLVGDALQVLERVGAPSAHIVGNSAGGYVAQQLAIHHPDRVQSLALFGSTPGLKHSHALTWIPKIGEIGLKRFLSDTISERFDQTADPALVKWFIEQAGSNDPAFIGRFVTHMCTHDFMEDLRQVRAPTLIVAAGREQIGHANTYQQMRDRIVGSKLEEIDTTGHNICDGYAERCVDLLEDFLGAQRSAAPASTDRL